MKAHFSFTTQVVPVVLLFGGVFTGTYTYAQTETPFHPRHSLGLNIGHEHSFSGIDEDGHREVAVLPYWGLDYNFQFARRFAIGLHTDFVTESFKVEKTLGTGENEVVERSYFP